MGGSISLRAEDRKTLLGACQRGPTVPVARRAQDVLLFAAGWSWCEVQAIAFVSFDPVRESLARQQRGRATV